MFVWEQEILAERLFSTGKSGLKMDSVFRLERFDSKSIKFIQL